MKMSVEDGLEYVTNKFSQDNLRDDVHVVLDDLIPALLKISTSGTKRGKVGDMRLFIFLVLMHFKVSPLIEQGRLAGDDPMVVDGKLIIQDKVRAVKYIHTLE